jgi:hypothetical protein
MATPALTDKFLAEKMKLINSKPYKDARLEDRARWLILNGSLRQIVQEAIQKEFKKPETVQELIERLIPINIMQKIVSKLANVYNEAPLRNPVDRNEDDNELMEDLESIMRLNQRQKEANRYFKTFKRNLQELYLDEDKHPQIRNLPRHTYEVFSHSGVSPDRIDTVFKIINDDTDPKKQIWVVWTDTEHVVVNGEGTIITEWMIDMGNPDGVNPFGVLPFIYISESTTSVNPVPDDDLLRMSIVIPLLLSDLAFAIKYLSWSVVYTIGAKGDIPYSPNSIIHLEFGPNGERPIIDTVKPDVNINDVLGFVEFLIAMLLTTKNLSTSAIKGKLDAANAASGIAKALDSAESQEDKKDQQSFFFYAEKELWDKLAHIMMPYWRENEDLAVEGQFSESFDLSILFREPKVIISERDQIEISKLKLEAGLTTLKRELQVLNPEFTDEEIEQLMQDIREEKDAAMNVDLDRAKLSAPGDKQHKHQGTGPAVMDGQGHFHMMADGSGKTSTAPFGPGHTHKSPNGKEIS